MMLRIAGIEPESITDGPGFRYAIFVQGCSHGCPGCHNSGTHDPMGGYEKSPEELIEDIRKNPLLSGVTFSGGEPFEQAAALAELGALVRSEGLELAAYSGYTFEELCSKGGDIQALLQLCHVLVDGRYIEAQRSLSLPFRGSKNQRIIDVEKSLKAGHPVELHDGRWQ